MLRTAAGIATEEVGRTAAFVCVLSLETVVCAGGATALAGNDSGTLPPRHLYWYTMPHLPLHEIMPFYLRHSSLKPCNLNHAGFRMSAYEEIRNRLSKHDKNGFSLWKKVLAGMLAGGELDSAGTKCLFDEICGHSPCLYPFLLLAKREHV